ncbi:MAG: hypothetical protein AAF490_31380 [Chloroflexota bacterium]
MAFRYFLTTLQKSAKRNVVMVSREVPLNFAKRDDFWHRLQRFLRAATSFFTQNIRMTRFGRNDQLGVPLSYWLILKCGGAEFLDV